MDLFTLDKVDWSGKRVILRGDLDINSERIKIQDSGLTNDARINALVKTVGYIKDKGAKYVLIIGHKGRPKGKDDEFSLRPLESKLSEKLNLEVQFTEDSGLLNQESKGVFLLENTRFDEREEKNDTSLAQTWADLADIYVNEAFASSHRDHASIVALPQAIKEKGGQVVAGFRFAEEITNLDKVIKNPEHPVVFLISGVKEDKLAYVDLLKAKAWVDKILVGGRLPDYLPEQEKSIKLLKGEKVVVAGLNQDKEDITINSINIFSEEITKSKTLVFAGPLGKYEEEGQRLGTQRVLDAVEISEAFKVAGGGDSEKAIKFFEKEQAFDWISVGGGAMLEFFANETLPGLQALTE